MGCLWFITCLVRVSRRGKTQSFSLLEISGGIPPHVIFTSLYFQIWQQVWVAWLPKCAARLIAPNAFPSMCVNSCSLNWAFEQHCWRLLETNIARIKVLFGQKTFQHCETNVGSIGFEFGARIIQSCRATPDAFGLRFEVSEVRLEARCDSWEWSLIYRFRPQLL